MSRYRRVIIDLEIGADPVAGVVAADDDPREFTGWLQLAAALERAAREPPVAGTHNNALARTVANAGVKPPA